ncbi:hypothetical protein APASM_0314 [Actinosynnema pretiosum subsp. pretiosum]|nr:hypothetical protein APASM_0314 [Actinosynnema pretiosum subsp. pretiosum]
MESAAPWDHCSRCPVALRFRSEPVVFGELLHPVTTGHLPGRFREPGVVR